MFRRRKAKEERRGAGGIDPLLPPDNERPAALSRRKRALFWIFFPVIVFTAGWGLNELGLIGIKAAVPNMEVQKREARLPEDNPFFRKAHAALPGAMSPQGVGLGDTTMPDHPQEADKPKPPERGRGVDSPAEKSSGQQPPRRPTIREEAMLAAWKSGPSYTEFSDESDQGVRLSGYDGMTQSGYHGDRQGGRCVLPRTARIPVRIADGVDTNQGRGVIGRVVYDVLDRSGCPVVPANSEILFLVSSGGYGTTGAQLQPVALTTPDGRVADNIRATVLGGVGQRNINAGKRMGMSLLDSALRLGTREIFGGNFGLQSEVSRQASQASRLMQEGLSEPSSVVIENGTEIILVLTEPLSLVRGY